MAKQEPRDDIPGATPQQMLNAMESRWLPTCVILAVIIHVAIMVGTSLTDLIGLPEQPEVRVNAAELEEFRREAEEGEERTRQADREAIEEAARKRAAGRSAEVQAALEAGLMTEDQAKLAERMQADKKAGDDESGGTQAEEGGSGVTSDTSAPLF